MEIIPAIDIIEGKCVRLTQGDYEKCTIYSGNPLEMAKMYEGEGFRRLHLVDLEGAKSSGIRNLGVLEAIAGKTSLSVDFGGGIKSDSDIRQVFEAGAALACLGSIIYTDPEKTREWIADYGKERIIAGTDVKEGMICIHGWKTVTDTTLFELLDDYGTEIRNLMCTDISRDGMLTGPAISLYKEIQEKYPYLSVIASGGVGSIGDVEELERQGIPSVIIGKAIYEKKIALKELSLINNR